MDERHLDQLTDGQRECLRLVLAHHNSKEIAVKLGVSASAVDKRIERAVQILAAPSRFAAARALAAREGGAAYDRLPSETIDLPSPAIAGATPVPDEPWWLVRRLFGLPTDAGEHGGARNRLGTLERLVVIVLLLFLVAMTSMALLNLGQTLSGLIHGESHLPRP